MGEQCHMHTVASLTPTLLTNPALESTTFSCPSTVYGWPEHAVIWVKFLTMVHWLGINLPSHILISQCLHMEAHLLGCAFDQLIAALPLDHYQQTPTFTFSHTNHSQSNCAPLPSGIPNLHALFGPLAPWHPATYSTTCNIQWCREADFTICLDTGCSMSSTPSLEDFEQPPIKGKFGHLWMINHIVPIKAAGLIWWHVLDSDGKSTVIHVPGYFIPSSGQWLLSPQSYTSYHKWADPTKDCYSGNDQHVWLHLASDSSDNSQLLMVPISALDSLLYIPGLPSPLLDAFPCMSSSCHCTSCSYANNLSILSPKNENLTAAQKALLLDHHHLGQKTCFLSVITLWLTCTKKTHTSAVS